MDIHSTIYDAFSKQVLKSPDNIAIKANGKLISYQQLSMLVNATADKIYSLLPQKRNNLIGILMDHSVEMITCILAILKSGNGFIPIETFFPKERISNMLSDSKATLIICQDKYYGLIDTTFPSITLQKLNAVTNISPLQVARKHNDTAYVLYTSGTTGKPKGVMVTNKNVLHYVNAFHKEFNNNSTDCMLQMSVCTFDIFIEEVFPTLLYGATLAILPEIFRENLSEIVNFCEENNVTMLSAFPYFIRELNNYPIFPKTLRTIISGGDILRKEFITNLIDKILIYNTYGPTEATVCASYYKCDHNSYAQYDFIPIGHPIEGATIFILDDNLRPVTIGEYGEICISGNGITNGYINNPTASQTFIQNPFNSLDRMYLSGDIGYELPDGNFVFVGRRDHQIMIEGKRVECMEVEKILRNHPEITDAIVVPVWDSQNYPHLLACIQSTSNLLTIDVITSYLKKYLIYYMIPEYYDFIDEFIININGKYDREAMAKEYVKHHKIKITLN